MEGRESECRGRSSQGSSGADEVAGKAGLDRFKVSRGQRAEEVRLDLGRHSHGTLSRSAGHSLCFQRMAPAVTRGDKAVSKRPQARLGNCCPPPSLSS